MQRRDWGWIGVTSTLVFGSVIAVVADAVNAQIVPDGTLENERSRVIRNFRGTPNEVIEGGARRGRNVFHSFREFNVDEGRGAYFLNDGDVRNIFSRVTGNNPSQILGTLGTIRIENNRIFPNRENPTNLYFINPNGIIFGRNSTLIVGGLFAATTANAIGFGDLGFFSATNPESPTPLLTVDPSAFLFNQVPTGSIINQSIASNLGQASNALGLQVLDQRSLLLVGGDVTLDGGRLNATGGRIELGGLAAPGTIELKINDDNLSLAFPQNTPLANVNLTNDAQVLLIGDETSSININANELNASDGGRLATITAGAERGGNIIVNANTINLAGTGQSGFSSQFLSSVPENTTGDGGDITVNTQSLHLQDEARILAGGFGAGDAGNIAINTTSLSISNGATIQNNALGQGNAGNVQIDARGDINIDSGESDRPTGIFTGASNTAGRSGNIDITANSLSINNSVGQISSNTLGQTGSGDITINVREQVSLDNRASINSLLLEGASGRVGNISITTGSLRLTNDAAISSTIGGQGINERGSGEINVNARDTVSINNSSISSGPVPGGVGRAGSIRIATGNLTLANNGSISATTSGNGDAGDITIDTRGVTSLDRSSNISSSAYLVYDPDPSDGINSRIVNPNISARSGNIVIKTNSLLLGQSVITTSLTGIGQAGNIEIDASGEVVLDRGSEIGSGSVGFDERLRSLGFDETLRSVGDAGDITITANSMTFRNGSQIISGIGNRSQGIGGDVTITLRGILSIDGTPNEGIGGSILTRLDPEAVGRGGDITIDAGSVILTNGAQLAANTRGQGDAGSIIVRASENLSLADRSGILSRVDTEAVGRGGNITVTADSVTLSNRSGLLAGVFGQGDAGNVTVTARDRVSLTEGSVILSNTEGRGNAGNVTIRADGNINITSRLSGISSGVNAGAVGNGGNLRIEASSLTLRNGGQLQTNTSGSGRAGNIVIDVEGSVRLSGLVTRSESGRNILSTSGITSSVERDGRGRAGRIIFRADSLSMDDLSSLSSSTSGRGNAGNLQIRVDGAINLNDLSTIRSGVESGGIGDAGNINIRARSITLTNGAQVVTVVARPGNNTVGGQGQGGNIRVNATDFIDTNGYSRNQRQIVDSSNPSITFLTTGYSSGFFTNSERGALGDAGNIFITTDRFRIANGGSVAASTANPNSDSGDITIDARNLEVSDGGQVVTATNSQGNAGNVTLNIADNIILTGSDPNFQQRREQIRRVLREPGQTDRVSDVLVFARPTSGIFANTQANSRGRGGSIDLDTNTLNLSNGATISSASQGRNRAGNITITADSALRSENGNITTSARQAAGGSIEITSGRIDLSQGSTIRTDVDRGSGSGGDITVNADAVRLQGNSDIQTRVGETGTGDGGNITITADSVIAFDDSDLITEAPNLGGDITLDTPVFFGAGYQADVSTAGNPDGNGRVDLDASGEVSSGAVQTPNTDFIQNSLSDLPTNAINTDQLLANSCIARTEQGGTFLITGPDGLPERPGQVQSSAYPTGEVRAIPEENKSEWQPGEPIVEPQGVYRLPDGRLVMSRECHAP